ncbi:hypothetical protein [Paenibacillus turpanensis]|uniref:hypothetical protein n=1 Tax=Paenibacillus turpanensis TaxID=2689078 RepID=UPI001407B51D|nr:hypothetical protein [Paenibacillus turpanensis]
MKLKKLLISGIVLSFIGTATVFADDALETFTGKRLGFFVDGTDAGVSAVNIDGTAMLPMNANRDYLQAIVNMDPTYNTVHVYKPNVHLSLFEVVKDSMRPFGNVSVGKYDFVVFAQVDSLKTSIHSFKVDIVDPNGKVVETKSKELTEQKDNFWYTTPTIRLDFKQTGKYMVKFYMQQTKDGPYSLVSQKAIMSMGE